METKEVKMLDAKKLGALIKKTKASKIISDIKVENGFLQVGLEYALFLHTDLEDGVYRIDMAEQGVFVKSSGNNYFEHESLPELEYKSLKPIQTDLFRASVVRGKDDLRPAMKGFYISPTIIAATDANKLFFKEGEFDYGEFILPKEMLDLMAGFKKEEFSITTVKETEDTTNVYVKFDYGYIVQRAIDAIYPNVRAVIPKSSTNFATIDRKELLSAVKALKPFVNKDKKQIQLFFQKDKLIVVAEDLDRSLREEFTLSIKTELNDCNSTINGVNTFAYGLNRDFTEVVLNAILDKEVKLEMTTSNRVMILNNEFLLMPLIIK